MLNEPIAILQKRPKAHKFCTFVASRSIYFQFYAIHSCPLDLPAQVSVSKWLSKWSRREVLLNVATIQIDPMYPTVPVQHRQHIHSVWTSTTLSGLTLIQNVVILGSLLHWHWQWASVGNRFQNPQVDSFPARPDLRSWNWLHLGKVGDWKS